MTENDFSQFHELAKQFKGEIPIKQLCEQEGMPYRSYVSWRHRKGIAPRKRRKVPKGLFEIEAEMLSSQSSPKATAVRIVFENGLTFERNEMNVDALVEFLTKIRGAMFRLTEDLRFYMYTGKVSLRKGCMSLCDVIRNEMKSDPRDERNVYIFMNRQCSIIRLIHYERGFYVIYEKRPGSGRFRNYSVKG